MIRTRQLVARTHHCVLATPRAGARILAPASSAPSPHRRDHRRCPGARGVVHSRRFFALAVSPAPPERRRAFASASAVGSETNEVIEADFTEKEKRASTATNADAGAQDQDLPPTADDYDDSATEWSVPPDWCGAAPGHAAYGRIVDSARLAAEFAYEENGAAVGALAEAAGEDGAGSRWLRGFLGLLEAGSFLPGWWHEGHREEVLRLAQRRNSGHYVKRCLDVPRLKAELGRDAYNKLEEVAMKVYTRVIKVEANEEEEEEEYEDEGDEMDDTEEDDVPLETLPLSKEAVNRALQIWGEDATRELFKKTPEEMEEEQNAQQMAAKGMTKVERGGWWGPAASHEQPEEAYRRLIDAARLGTSLAYEKNGHFKGMFADATVACNIDIFGDLAREADTEEADATNVSNDNDQESPHSYKPGKLGENTIAHFRQFLEEMKGDNPEKEELMPEWWDDNHEDAVWKLAADKDGSHFLGHSWDASDMKKNYKKDARHKILSLAQVASEAGDHACGHMSDLNGDYDDANTEQETAADYAEMTVPQLKEELREKGLKVGGRKAELIARLGGQDGAPDYHQRKVAWLRDELRGRGLRVSGRKAELIARLESS